MALVAQDADDLRRQGFVQQLDDGLAIAPVAGCYGSLFDMLPGPVAQGLDIGQKLICSHVSSICISFYILLYARPRFPQEHSFSGNDSFW
jgi:hypothetical protein